MVAVGLAGCDRLPWSSNSKENQATAALTIGSAAVSPSRPTVLSGDVIATVNGVQISKADVELRVEELKLQTLLIAPEQEWTPLSGEELEAVLEELVNAELMTQDAIAKDLHRGVETQRRWEFIRRGFMAQEWLRWGQERMVSNAEVERYYEQNKQGFREPERIKVRQLTLETQLDARQALARLHGESAKFGALAREMSRGPTAAQGGLVRGWVMRANDKVLLFGSDTEAAQADVSSLDPVLEAAAFAIDQVGGISNYVKGADNRYHIFELVERQEGRQLSMNEVWDGIQQFLLGDKLQQVLDGLVSQAQISRFPERLEDVSQ